MNNIKTLLLINKIKRIPKYLILYIVRFTPWVHFLPERTKAGFRIKALTPDLKIRKSSELVDVLSQDKNFSFSFQFMRKCSLDDFKFFFHYFVEVYGDNIKEEVAIELILNLGFNNNKDVTEMFSHIKNTFKFYNPDNYFRLAGYGAKNNYIPHAREKYDLYPYEEELEIAVVENDADTLISLYNEISNTSERDTFLNEHRLCKLLNYACVFRAEKTGTLLSEYLKIEYYKGQDLAMFDAFNVLSKYNDGFLLDKFYYINDNSIIKELEMEVIHCNNPEFLVKLCKLYPEYEQLVILNINKYSKNWIVN